MESLSVRTGGESPRPATTAPSGSGTRRPARCCSSSGGTAGRHGLAFSVAMGSRLVTGGIDGQVKVWDASSGAGGPHSGGARAGRPAPPSAPTADGSSPPGRPDAEGLGGALGPAALRWEGTRRCDLRVAFSPDGSLIASAAGIWSHSDRLGEVKVWDAATGRVNLHLAGPQGDRLDAWRSAPTAADSPRAVASTRRPAKRSSSGTSPRASGCTVRRARLRRRTGRLQPRWQPARRDRWHGHPRVGRGDGP